MIDLLIAVTGIILMAAFFAFAFHSITTSRSNDDE